MKPVFLLIALLLPLLGGLGLFVRPARTRRGRNLYVFFLCLASSLLVLAMVVWRPEGTFTLLPLGLRVSLSFRLDGLSVVFALILAVLWPITNLYAFEYMSHEHGENRFFGFFTMTYGVVLGISFAANLFTLYFFYELLTLCTLPLVMHEMDGKGRYAGKKYLFFSMAGAAMAFLSMVVLYHYGSLDFALGGSLTIKLLSKRNLLLFAFLLGFFGFGVKAAVWPFHSWLPTAGVAPTPVTALLHAVAVVNAGLFAVLRLIYYCYGPAFLIHSWAQHIAMAAAIFTIVYGSTMAWRVPHLKRRLAFSTVSNLSYILFAATLMSHGGLVAALSHMTIHSLLKITLFFCAGSILCQHEHKPYIWQYEGLAKKMPVTCAAFGVASLGLMGVPPLPGFFTKWMIAERAALTGDPLAWLGAFALVISAFLTGLYLVQVLIIFYCPTKDRDLSFLSGVTEAGWQIKTALLLLCALIVAAGFAMTDIPYLLSQCASDLI